MAVIKRPDHIQRRLSTAHDTPAVCTFMIHQWADAGSVLFNFERMGVVRVNKGVSEDEVSNAVAP